MTLALHLTVAWSYLIVEQNSNVTMINTQTHCTHNVHLRRAQQQIVVSLSRTAPLNLIAIMDSTEIQNTRFVLVRYVPLKIAA